MGNVKIKINKNNAVFPDLGKLPVSREVLLGKLEQAKQDYIDSYYPAKTQQELLIYAMSSTATENGKAAVQLVWDWLRSVLDYANEMEKVIADLDAAVWPDLKINFHKACSKSVPITSVKYILAADEISK